MPHPLALSCEGSFSRVRFLLCAGSRAPPPSPGAITITCSPECRSVHFAAGPGAISYKEAFEKFHEPDVVRERTSSRPQGPYVR